MDPAPHPGPETNPDPAPFFSDLKDIEEKKFHIFFLITYPQAHYFQSQKVNFLL
jgi:hypothetical protein